MALAPSRIMTRAAVIVTMDPNPMALPGPMAAQPDIVGAWWCGRHFGIRRGRCILHDYFGAFRRTRRFLHHDRRRRGRWRFLRDPTTFDPEVTALPRHPMAWLPNGIVTWATVPMAVSPDPVVVFPVPMAFHPEIIRAGRGGGPFNIGLGRGLAHNDYRRGGHRHANSHGDTEVGPPGEGGAGNDSQ